MMVGVKGARTLSCMCKPWPIWWGESVQMRRPPSRRRRGKQCRWRGSETRTTSCPASPRERRRKMRMMMMMMMMAGEHLLAWLMDSSPTVSSHTYTPLLQLGRRDWGGGPRSERERALHQPGWRLFPFLLFIFSQQAGNIGDHVCMLGYRHSVFESAPSSADSLGPHRAPSQSNGSLPYYFDYVLTTVLDWR